MNIEFDPSLETIPKRLKFAREARGMSRKQLAAASGVSEKTIQHYEYDSIDLKVKPLESLADALGVPSQQLFFGVVSEVVDEIGISQSADDNAGARAINRNIARANEAMFVLDHFREKGFLRSPITAHVAFKSLDASLKQLEVADLERIGTDRSLEPIVEHAWDKLSEAAMLATFAPNAEGDDESDGKQKAKENDDADVYAAFIDRIIDTVYFGEDLYRVDFQLLSEYANSRDIGQNFFGPSYKSHIDLVPRIRESLRHEAFIFDGPVSIDALFSSLNLKPDEAA